MKISKKSIVILALVALASGFVLTKVTDRSQEASKGGAVYYCPMHPTYTSDRPGTCPICNMNLVKREEVPVQNPALHDHAAMGKEAPQKADERNINKQAESICLMHNCPKYHDGQLCPMLVLAKPGEEVTCSICGTHLIQDGKNSVTLKTPEGYAPVLITPQKQQLIGIKTSVIKRRPLTKTIRAAGTIAHDPELYQAQSEYIQSIQAYERARQGTITEIADQARKLVESTRIRLKHMGLSDELIAEIATWKEPEHGLLFAHPGDPVWVYANIYEYELPLVHVGQELSVEVPALPGKIFQGKIRAIDPMVESATRTIRIRAQVMDEAGQLKPDMYVNASIVVNLGEMLAVAQEAVFDTGAQKIVFVDKGQGLFEPREVVVGAKTDDDYELKSGISEGETVVTNGNFLIDSESRLKAALGGMEAGGGHQHGQ